MNAKWVVIATHYPIINFGFYFLRMHQTRSYVLGINNVPELHGMYLDVREYGLSFRARATPSLLGGAGHRCGKNPPPARRRADIRFCAKRGKVLPETEICYQWSAYDCMTADGILYRAVFQIHPRLLVATGFNKWA